MPRSVRSGTGSPSCPASACPHYDGEERRAGTYQALVAEGFPAGYAADDGCGLLFEDGRLADVVSSRPGADGYRVEATEGGVTQTPLGARYLGVADTAERCRGYSDPPSSSETLS